MRIDQIMELIENYSKQISLDEIRLGNCEGISVYEIADELNMLRNNVNVEVNKLFEQDKIIKIKGKIMRYYSKEVLEKKTHHLLKKQCTCTSLKSLIEQGSSNLRNEQDIFQDLIGYDSSLKQAIYLAKAAILYPKKPLHSLILGESGVGKSLFAEKMFQFGISEHIFNKEAKLVVFNCADYANNPNLLLSYLFGSKKGAYTDSLEDRTGLIEEADHGMLFLDEVHRLPPEGQEMLFYFLDKKKYRRLGESSIERKANVVFVLATTQEPKDALLATFLRRIEMIIAIPSLKEKSLTERKQLVFGLYAKEADHIEYKMRIDREVLLRLLDYYPLGNIGQLQNDIKLTIARAFVDMHVQNMQELHIQLNHLSQNVLLASQKSNLETRHQLEVILHDESYVIEPFDSTYKKSIYQPIAFSEKQNLSIQENFHHFAEELSSLLSSSQLEMYIDDPEIIELMLLVTTWCSKNLNIILDKGQNAALAIYLKNIKDHLYESTDHIQSHVDATMLNKTKEFVKLVESQVGFVIPSHEIYQLSVIFESLCYYEKRDLHEQIYVCAHGQSTASSIAHVVNSLLSIEYVKGIDMPLDQNMLDIAPLLAKDIKNKSNQKNLIFVDLISMLSLQQLLKEQYEIYAIVIPTVNLLVILEATRKIVLLHQDMSSVLDGICKNTNKLNNMIESQVDKVLHTHSKKIIYTICRSNEGTALFLEKHLKDIFERNGIYTIDVIALQNDRIIQLKEFIQNTAKEENVLALVGTIDLHLEHIPFISLHDILFGNGMDILFSSIDEIEPVSKKEIVMELKRETAITTTLETIDKYLLYFDAKKLHLLIKTYIELIEKELGVVFDNNTVIDLIVHLSYLIERLVFKEYEFNHMIHDQSSKKEERIKQAIRKTISYLEMKFHVQVSDQEISYIGEIILRDTHVEKDV